MILDFVILDLEFLKSQQLEIEQNPGNTPLRSLVDTHRDIVKLTYSKLCPLKDHIVNRIKLDKLKRYTKGDLKNLLKKAIENKELEIDTLNPTLREKINS